MKLKNTISKVIIATMLTSVFQPFAFLTQTKVDAATSYTDVTSKMTSNTAPIPQKVNFSSQSSTYQAWKAFDDVSTSGSGSYWSSGTTANGWIEYDLGTSNSKIIKQYSLTSYGTTNTPTSWTFEGSNDGTSYTVLDIQSGHTWSSYEKKSFDIANNDAYQKYKINVTATNGTLVYISEIQMNGFDLVPPTTPSNFTVEDGDGTAALRWTANAEPDINSYNIYQNGIKINTSQVTKNFFNVSNLTNGNAYDFQISAVDDSGNESEKTTIVTSNPGTGNYGLLDGKPMNVGSNIYDLTDNDPSTGNYLSNFYGTYTFPTPVSISSYSLISDADIEINFYDSSNTLKYKVATPTRTGTKVTIPVIGDVKKVEVRRTASYTRYVYDFDVFVGSESVKPEIPTGLRIENGEERAALYWNANSDTDIYAYNIYKDGIKINTAPVKKTFYNVIDLTNETEYDFQITAVDLAANESDKTSIVKANPGTGNYTLLDGKLMNIGGSTIDTLTDNDSSTGNSIANGYANYTFATPVKINSYSLRAQNETSLKFYDSSNKLKYYIAEPTRTGEIISIPALGDIKKVEVVKNTSYTKYIYEFDVYAGTETNPPAKPTGFVVENGDGMVTMNWVANSDSDIYSYNVYQDGVKINTTPILDTFYNVPGLTNGTTYKFSISAVDLAGNESEKTAEISAKPKQYAGSLLDLKTIKIGNLKNNTVSSTTALVTDNDTSTKSNLLYGESMWYEFIEPLSISGYRLSSTNEIVMYFYDSTKTLKYQLVPTTNYSVKSIPTLTDIKYVELKLSTNYGKTVSEWDLYSSLDSVAPLAPTGLSGTGGDKEANLSWTSNTEEDIQGYYIYQNGVKISDVVTDSKYKVTGLTNDTEYNFQISAVDLSDNESDLSDSVKVVVGDKIAPVVPINVSSSNGDGEVRLSWNANTESDIDGYLVYRNGLKITETVLKSNSYVDTLVLNGGTYNYEISAIDIHGNESAKSALVTGKPRSANNNLSNLVSSTGTLTPTFSSSVTSYQIEVESTITNIAVKPTAEHNAATVKVNGNVVISDTFSNMMNVPAGTSTITIEVTAQNGTTKNYVVTVKRNPSSDANLDGITISDGTLSPVFSEDVDTYTVTVPYDKTELTITPGASGVNSTIKVNGVEVTSSNPSVTIPLNVGSNPITIEVIAEDGTSKTYTIDAVRAKSPNNNLSAITLSKGTLNPVFNKAPQGYTAIVSHDTTSIKVTATKDEANASITINGVNASSGVASNDIPLSFGVNKIEVNVTAQNGDQKKYVINVTRALNTNADLQSLSTSKGTLSPVFNAETLNYTTIVTNDTSAITVTPTLADSNAKVKVNGLIVSNGQASASLPLSVGANTITVVTTAQDNVATKTYKITVTRAASSDATLENLSLNNGTIAPVFNPNTLNYTAAVSNSVSAVKIKPTAKDALAVIKVNGATVVTNTFSGDIPLAVGENAITVQVTAQDTLTKKTYVLYVTRQPSTNANLSNIVLNNGILTPSFNKNTTNYSISVGNSITAIKVTPTVEDNTATLKVNGVIVANGAQSGAISLVVGTNTITIDTTAQDGVTKKSYKLVVDRAKNSDANLSNLEASIGAIFPVFDSNQTSYIATVSNNISSLTVKPTVAESTSTITVNGNVVASGTNSNPVFINFGANNISIVVTAQDGTKKEYTLIITREASSVADLTSLSLNSASLSPTFTPIQTSYVSSVNSNVSTVTFVPVAADPNSTIRINGNVVTSGVSSAPIPLQFGLNTIRVTVTAQDGYTVKNYTVIINKTANSNANLENILLSSGGLNPNFETETTAYSVKVPNNISVLSITPVSSDSTSTISINNEVLVSGTAKNVNLNVGVNLVSIVVTAQNGTTVKTYTVSITREPNNDASLLNLSLSKGSLSPLFDSNVYFYNVNLSSNITSVKVLPVASNSNARIKVNNEVVANNGASKDIELKAGANTITVDVIAQDGVTKKTYEIKVNRNASANADLLNVALSAGNLPTGFSPGTFSYMASIPKTATTVALTPFASDSKSTIRVNGLSVANGTKSQDIALVEGENNFTIAVLAEDGMTMKIYNISTNIDRTPPKVPTIVDVEEGDTEITLSWSPNRTDSDYYGVNIYMNGLQVNKEPVRENSYRVTNLVNDRTYNFQITAVDKSNNESTKSAIRQGTPRESSFMVDIMEISYLHTQPNSAYQMTAYIGPQTVKAYELKNGYYRIQTWLGQLWVPEKNILKKVNKTIELTERKNLYNESNLNTLPTSSIAPQKVNVFEEYGDWVRIQTWLGDKWINLRSLPERKILNLTARVELFNNPNFEDSPITSVAPQLIEVLEEKDGWYRVKTWLGNDNWLTLTKKREYVTFTEKLNLYSTPSNDKKMVNALNPQTVEYFEKKVSNDGTWYRVKTWLGNDKWLFIKK